MKTYAVTGPNGIGKSTVLAMIAEKRPEWFVKDGSELLMAGLGLEPGDYAALRRMPQDRKEKAWLETVKEMHSCREEGIAVIGTHLFNLTEGQVEDRWPPELGNHFDGVFLLMAPVYQLLRRLVDSGREEERALFQPGTSACGKEFALDSYLVRHAYKLEAIKRLRPSLIVGRVENADGHAEGTADRIITAIEGVLSA